MPSPQFDLSAAALPSGMTLTRASTARVDNVNGTLVSSANDNARFEHSTSTRRVNWIRNNAMAGAVAGTPGTMPTNWTDGIAAVGLNRQVVAVGTTGGNPYIDIRYYGTVTAANTCTLQFDTFFVVPPNTPVTGSVYLGLVAGSLVGSVVNGNSGILLRWDATDTYGGANTYYSAPLALTAATPRYTHTPTLLPSARDRGYFGIAFTPVVGAVDFTLRVLLPQAELGSTATSPITSNNTAGSNFAGNTGTYRGLLLESAATNSCLYSADLTNAVWTKNAGSTVQSDIVFAPDGSRTADLIVDTGNAGVTQTIATGVALLLISAYVRPGTSKSIRMVDNGANNFGYTLDTTTGTLTGASSGAVVHGGSAYQVGDGWWRIWLKITSVANLALTWCSSAAGTFCLWGSDVKSEDYAGPSSHIPTTNVAVTRAADNISLNLGAQGVANGAPGMLRFSFSNGQSVIVPGITPTAGFFNSAIGPTLTIYQTSGHAVTKIEWVVAPTPSPKRSAVLAETGSRTAELTNG